MLNLALQQRITSLMHAELAKRLLLDYFQKKNLIERFDAPLNPITIADIPSSIPELSRKIEVVPYVYKIDPFTGSSELGWNLFVLGNNRLYLGRTQHKHINELLNIMGVTNEAAVELASTPRDVTKFISDTLSKSEDGKVDIGYQPIVPQFMRKPTISSPVASYYEKRRYGK